MDSVLYFVEEILYKVNEVKSYQDNCEHCQCRILRGEKVDFIVEHFIHQVAHVVNDRVNKLILQNDELIKIIDETNITRLIFQIHQ